jgi:hypothetical protein
MTSAASWIHFPAYRLPLDTFGRTMLIGAVDPAGEGPQVQAILQDFGSVIPAHFHDVDQFQLVVGGGGIIGRHHFARGMVRYVDRHRVYGPVRPDDEGLVYLTLRRVHDAGPFYMPDSRDELAERRAVDPRGLGFDCEALDTCWRDVSYEDADGLAVRAHNLGRLQESDVTMDGDGGFVIVIGGSLDDGLPIDAVSLCWLDSGAKLTLHASKTGARVMQLQFPIWQD